VTLVVAAPLTRAAYAPFGELVAPGDPAKGRPVNQGTARRWDNVADVATLRARAALDLAVFRCAPLRAFPHAVALLERHRLSTQVFLPLRARRYLVVVALGGDAPDLATLAAFIAPPDVGISYRPGVWHHPMMALDDDADFACLVWEDGTSADCDEHAIPEPARPRIALG